MGGCRQDPAGVIRLEPMTSQVPAAIGDNSRDCPEPGLPARRLVRARPCRPPRRAHTSLRACFYTPAPYRTHVGSDNCRAERLWRV